VDDKMMDIVERLRRGEPCDGGNQCRIMEASSGCTCAEAADEIERLRAVLKDRLVLLQDAYAQIERLREEVARLEQKCIKLSDAIVDVARHAAGEFPSVRDAKS
jgi:hypothetical protein